MVLGDSRSSTNHSEDAVGETPQLLKGVPQMSANLGIPVGPR